MDDETRDARAAALAEDFSADPLGWAEEYVDMEDRLEKLTAQVAELHKRLKAYENR